MSTNANNIKKKMKRNETEKWEKEDNRKTKNKRKKNKSYLKKKINKPSHLNYLLLF